MSEIININNSEKLGMDFDAWKLLEHNNIAVIRINMKVGYSVAEHINEKTVVFHVLGGEGKLTIDGQPFLPVKGDSIKVENGKMRSWTVIGESPLELLVVKFL